MSHICKTFYHIATLDLAHKVYTVTFCRNYTRFSSVITVSYDSNCLRCWSCNSCGRVALSQSINYVTQDRGGTIQYSQEYERDFVGAKKVPEHTCKFEMHTIMNC